MRTRNRHHGHLGFWQSLFLIVTFLLVISHSADAAGPTYVSGEIAGQVVWTKDNSPYILRGDVTVAAGSRLEIREGAVVKAQWTDTAKPYTRRTVLRVQGELVVNGSSVEPVIFTGYEEGIFGYWGGIWVDGFYGGTAVLNWAEIAYAERGLYASGTALGSVSIVDSQFSSNFAGIYLENALGVSLTRTVVASNEYGLYADASEVSASFNMIVSNIWGVYSLGDSAISLSNNDIKSNTFGYSCEGATRDEISYNDFSIRNRNDYGIYILDGAPAVLTNNNFLFDDEVLQDPKAVFWYVFNEGPDDVLASGNWWDTQDEPTIAHYIYDGIDDPGRGIVTFTPVATEPVANTVDDIRAPVVSIISMLPFSPNGDGFNDWTTISYSLSEDAANVYLEVISAGGTKLYARKIDGATQPELVTDGAHEIQWDGSISGGGIIPDGSYTVKMWADDLVKPELIPEETQRILEVDCSPPSLSVLTPLDGETFHTHRITVSGTISDRDPSPNVRAKGENAFLESGTFRVEVTLDPGVNRIVTAAKDWAGNESSHEMFITFSPVITLTVDSPTNAATQVVTGTVESSSGSSVQVFVVDSTGTTRQYSTDYPGGPNSFSSEPISLTVGENTVTAVLLDGEGAVIGDYGAVIKYDPNVDQVLSFDFPAGLQMMGMPINPNNGDHGAVLGQVAPKLARWQKAENWGYVYYPDSGLETFAVGRGFWLEADGEVSGSVIGTVADPAKQAIVALSPGWNQISNPFLVARDFQQDVQVRVDGRQYSMSEAIESGWVARGLWGYSGGYVLSNTLEAWKGYWVRASREMELVVSPPNVIRSAKVLSSNTCDAWLGASPGGVSPQGGSPEWTVEFTADSGSVSDRTWFGMRPGTGPGYDRLDDLFKPPPGPNGFSISILGAGEKPERLAADFRDFGSGEREKWTILVEPGQDEQDITFRWNPRDIGGNAKVYLIDGQKRIAMNEVSTYEIGVKGSTMLYLEAEMKDVKQKVTDLFIYPNPLTAGRDLKIRFRLELSSEIEILVYDLVGSLVYSETVHVPAGVNEVRWSGRSTRGNQVANGLYYLVIKADGVQAAGRIGVLK